MNTRSSLLIAIFLTIIVSVFAGSELVCSKCRRELRGWQSKDSKALDQAELGDNLLEVCKGAETAPFSPAARAILVQKEKVSST
jgi:hypothetical protein